MISGKDFKEWLKDEKYWEDLYWEDFSCKINGVLVDENEDDLNAIIKDTDLITCLEGIILTQESQNYEKSWSVMSGFSKWLKNRDYINVIVQCPKNGIADLQIILAGTYFKVMK